mgnify:CR=1 FL=1
MKQLIETETFELLLSDNSKTATDNLIKEIIRLGETEANLASLYRTLHYTRFHLERGCVKIGTSSFFYISL